MKRTLAVLALGLAVLLGVVLLQASRFTSKQLAVDPAPAVTLDRQALAERLAGALRFQTISHQDDRDVNGDEFRALHRYLAEKFPLVHARLQRETVNDYSLLYTWQGSEPARKPIVLLSHLDVVPVEPGTESLWHYPPFEGRIAEGYIWGRGALDDKFGVLGILEAVEILLRGDFRPRTTVYLAFGHDEELGGERGAAPIAALLASRGVAAEYVLDEGGAVMSGILPNLAVPVACVGIAEKGSVSIELLVHAEGGHSSAPPPSTAIGIASTAVHQLEVNQMPAGLGGPMRYFIAYVGPEMPFVYRLVFGNLWLLGPLVERQLVGAAATNASIRTTTAATIIEGGVKENVLPSSARAVVNFRIMPGDSVQSVIDHARRVVNDPRVEVRPMAGAREPSRESPIDTPGFALLQRTIRQVYPGVIVAPYLTIGGTDARNYGALTPSVYRFTPIVGDPSDLARLHGTNERKSVEHYERTVQFFLQLIKNSAS